MTNRLDVEMSSRGIVRSRSAATDLIKRGKVRINGKIATKPNQEATPEDLIEIAEGTSFVGRAGEKLAHALTYWKIDVTGLTVIDIGSSTGGFSDCLLQNGAEKIIAIDVGTDQLSPMLRADPRVEVYEKTDVRSFSLAALASPLQSVDMVVADVSFISLELILPKVYEFVKKGGRAIVLVKPQFEVGKEIADENRGVITDEKDQKNALQKIETSAKKMGFKIIGNTISPLLGEKGNKEFLLLLEKTRIL